MANPLKEKIAFWPIMGMILYALTACSPDVKVSEPNLLIIMTDEHNFRTLGSYRKQLSNEQAFVWGGGINVATPHIDYLANNGALFNKFYAVTPICTPSRASFVSGMYPQSIGMTKNYQTLPDSVVTFGEILLRDGYKTGYAGKWHLDGYGKPQWSPERKFGFKNNKYMFNRGHWKKMKESDSGPVVAGVNKKGKPNYDLDGADEKTYTTDFLTDKAIAFIQKNKKDKFAYMLSYPDPHGPDRVRPPYDVMYDDLNFKFPLTYHKRGEDIPTWAQKDKRVKSSDQSQYFGMVKAIDDNIGRLLNYLRREELLQNTVLVVTADHGDMRTEHHKMNKGNPLEASAKVPFIVHYPPKINPGSVIHNAFNSVDAAPTLLSLLRQQVPKYMEGADLTPLLFEPSKQDEWKDITVIRNQGWVSAITSRYKLVLSENDKPWLIDMKENPSEVVNFINEPNRQSIVKDLATALKEYGVKYDDPLLRSDNIITDIQKLTN